jgi:hypothetical protein
VEKIGDIISRVLKKENYSCEEKDYLALWEEIVSKATRRHARATIENEKMLVWADNPTAHHQLFLQKEKIVAEFQKRGLRLKEITIKQAGGKNVPRFNRSAGHAV